MAVVGRECRAVYCTVRSKGCRKCWDARTRDTRRGTIGRCGSSQEGQGQATRRPSQCGGFGVVRWADEEAG